MRPRRLELEGFASFRERVEIDFADADVFALSGPTGAGKSSLIDALTFALYGAVPRYDNQALVWPVISQGMSEARVRLDFSVGDVAYSTVRVVRRTAGGATTKEARLEDATGRTLAGTADELSREIERLIGLPFKHFIRCVVLPQGDFAAFLHARAGERQDLLVQLLGLDVYRRIAQAANQRHRASAEQATVIEHRLGQELALATEDALRAANERVSALSALLESIEAARTELEQARAELERATASARQAESNADLLEAVAMPDGTDRLARQITESAAARDAAEVALHQAGEAREAAQDDLERAGERAEFDALLEKHGRRAKLYEQAAAISNAVANAGEEDARAASALDDAQRALRAANERLDQLNREHSAACLAEHLAIGEPCPVCQQNVARLPARTARPDLDIARADRDKAERVCDQARRTAQTSAQALAAKHADARGLDALIEQLEAELEGRPDPEAIAPALERIVQAEAALKATRTAEAKVREQLKQAQRVAAETAAAGTRARNALHVTRDSVAARGLAPPAVEGLDLHEDWVTLVAWVGLRAKEEREKALAACAAADAARTRIDAKMRDQLDGCTALDITVAGREPRDACADVHARARADADRIARDIETARSLRDERARLVSESRLARELARHLDARSFERWLMNRALRQLVADATVILRQLSAESYSLALDDKNEFLVVDHRNANEKRMARTLSGGETFMASLALALALAEHVAGFSTTGAARLEALFLDEGFGALDADTLDTVAAAIEELGARGRMVGIITHVRDLAERIPVRFEVRKIGSVSSVTRVVD